MVAISVNLLFVHTFILVVISNCTDNYKTFCILSAPYLFKTYITVHFVPLATGEAARFAIFTLGNKASLEEKSILENLLNAKQGELKEISMLKSRIVATAIT